MGARVRLLVGYKLGPSDWCSTREWCVAARGARTRFCCCTMSRAVLAYREQEPQYQNKRWQCRPQDCGAGHTDTVDRESAISLVSPLRNRAIILPTMSPHPPPLLTKEHVATAPSFIIGQISLIVLRIFCERHNLTRFRGSRTCCCTIHRT